MKKGKGREKAGYHNGIEVIRVEPLEIPADIAWRISGLHHITLKDFYVYVEETKDKMYVNKLVPEKDIKRMIEVMTDPGEYILEDDTENGQFMEYVYEKYGYAAYSTLANYHQRKMEQRDDQEAKEKAQEILPLIEEIVTSDHPAIHYNESLIYEILKEGRKSERKTVRNKIGYEDIYVFILGALVGMGKVNADDYSLYVSGNVLDYYYETAEMLEHIDMREMPRIYDYLKEMYYTDKSEA